jgi:hypothetical protein
MDKQKIDIEAKSRGCKVYDYELYKHIDTQEEIRSYVFMILFILFAYFAGYIYAKGGL